MIACVVKATCDCGQPDCPRPGPHNMILVLFANPSVDTDLVEKILKEIEPNLDGAIQTFDTHGDEVFDVGRSIVYILRLPELVRKVGQSMGLENEVPPSSGPHIESEFDFSGIEELDIDSGSKE